MPLRVIFFGTPSFAVPSLRSLLDSPHTVVAVVTQPDRPRGRGHKRQPEAVKRLAVERGLRISEPERLKDPQWLAEIRALDPDIAVVAAYGRMLPQALLDIPRLGFINVHASLLPRWRGAAPVHRAIVEGDTVTGVTIMRVVLELDAGPMIASEVTPIDPDETSVDVEARLATMGAALARDVVTRMDERDAVALQPQDEALATYAKKLERADSRFDWNTPAIVIHNRIRGLHPWPLAATRLRDRRLLLIRSIIEQQGPTDAEPGSIVAARRDGLLVAAGPGIVRITELQPEGRRPMSVGDFLNGAPVREGDRFEMV